MQSVQHQCDLKHIDDEIKYKYCGWESNNLQ